MSTRVISASCALVSVPQFGVYTHTHHWALYSVLYSVLCSMLLQSTQRLIAAAT